MKKKQKLPSLSNEHKEALARLIALPDFKALEGLIKIEENNIIMQTFRIPSSDTDLNRRKAYQEGRIYELRKIVKTFREVRKGQDE